MLKKFSVTALAVGLMTIPIAAHDLFLRLDTYFLQPNSKATVRLLNGTFQSSEGLVARERLREVSFKSPDTGATVAAITWRAEETTTIMESKPAARELMWPAFRPGQER